MEVLYLHPLIEQEKQASPDTLLAKAEQRVTELDLDNVKLHQMNAQNLEFADNSFNTVNTVIVLYVLSVLVASWVKLIGPTSILTRNIDGPQP